MKSIKKLYLIVSLFWVSSLEAQDIVDNFKSIPIRYSLRGEGGISRAISPRVLKDNFYPTGDFGLSFQVGLWKGLSAGVIGRFSSFQVDPQRLNILTDTTILIDGFSETLPIRTYQNHLNAGLVLSYDVWADESVFFNFSLSGGMSNTIYTKVRSKISSQPKSNYNFQTLFIEPSASIFYVFEDNIGMSFKVSYTYIDRNFRPETLALDGGVMSYLKSDLDGNINFLTFSLGFIYSIKPF